MEAALCLSYSQIVDGEATCEYCYRAASVLVSTGADPDPAPLCWHHARTMIDAAVRVGDEIFPVTL